MEQPYCLQTERILIACLLLQGDSDVFDQISSIVQEDDFYNEKTRQLFKCIKTIFSKGQVIDEVLLLDEIRSEKADIDLKDIYSIQDTASTTLPALSSAKIVAERSRARQLLRATRLACLLYTSPSPRDGTKSRMPSSA